MSLDFEEAFSGTAGETTTAADTPAGQAAQPNAGSAQGAPTDEDGGEAVVSKNFRIHGRPQLPRRAPHRGLCRGQYRVSHPHGRRERPHQGQHPRQDHPDERQGDRHHRGRHSDAQPESDGQRRPRRARIARHRARRPFRRQLQARQRPARRAAAKTGTAKAAAAQAPRTKSASAKAPAQNAPMPTTIADPRTRRRHRPSPPSNGTKEIAAPGTAGQAGQRRHEATPKPALLGRAKVSTSSPGVRSSSSWDVRTPGCSGRILTALTGSHRT